MSVDMATLGDLVASGPNNFVDGPFGSNLKASEYQGAGVPIIRLQNIRPHQFLDKDIKFISRQKAIDLARHDYGPGDLVIAKLGNPTGVACIIPADMPAGGTIGNCHIYPDALEPGIMHSDLLRVRVSSKKADAQFISSQFAYSSKIQSQLELMSPGAVMPGINVTKLKKLFVESPPLDLQHRFATIVESVERQKARLRTHLAELDALFASLQSRAFNGEL